MKRIISLILCFVLVLQASFAYASEQKNNVNENVFKNFDVSKALMSSEMGTVKKEVINNGITSYSYMLENGESGIALERIDADGNRYYNFKEGTLSNNLCLKSNGDIFLDGIEIEYNIQSSAVSFNDEIKLDNAISPQGRRYYKVSYSEACPYGSASEYSSYVKSFSTNIAFQRMLKSIAVGVIASIIVAAITKIPGINEYLSATLSIGSGVFMGVADYMQKKSPEAVATRADIKRYQRASGRAIPSVIVGETRFAYKDEFKYYVDIGESSLTYLTTKNLFQIIRIMG